MEKLFIVVPAYNEEANIENLVRDWYPVVERHNVSGSSRLVVVNDGSTDQTGEVLRHLRETRPCLEVLTKKNGGHGPAVLAGYRYALKSGADFVFQTDSDGQTDPRDFGRFWDLRDGYDAIFGSRTDRKDGRGRVFTEKTLCLILRVIFGVRLPDSNAPFRLMKAAYLRECLAMIPENYALPNVMLTVLGARYGKKICFLPIRFGTRAGGKNSINMRKIIKIGFRSVKEFREIKKNLPPV